MEKNNPIKIDKIMISPKRMIYIKLWPPSHHSKWGMTRSNIELQEAKISEEKEVTYGSPLRFPCDGSTALLADLISNFILTGRQLNTEYKNKNSKSSSLVSQKLEKSEQDNNTYINLESVLLSEFKGKKLSKTRILNILNDKGYDIDNKVLLEALEELTRQEKVSKEQAVHSTSGRKYFLWIFR